MQPTQPDITALAEMSDPLGVLSVYIDADPEGVTGARPTWAIAIDNRLAELRDDARQGETHDRWTAIQDALDRLAPRIRALADPALSGRGRALFAPLSEERVEEVVVQMPLETRVVLDGRAHLAPLLAALDEGRPTGIVNVARDGIRLVDLRLGIAEEEKGMDFHIDTAHWGQKQGTPGMNPGTGALRAGVPSGGGPATGSMYQQSGQPQKDRFDTRMETFQVRFVSEAAEDVLKLARERGWERMVVAGDPRLTHAMLDAVPETSGLETLAVEGTFEWQRPAQLAEALAPAIEEAQRRREGELVTQARERAAAGGRGAEGPAAVGEALVEGRVEVLLVEAGREIEGVRAPDGRIAPLGVVPEGARPEELEPEPRLDERMIEMALGGSARVVPVEGAAADALAEAGGVAAILRW